MGTKKKEKFTVAFSTYEADQLNSLQLSYLYARSRLSYVPSVNEILKATVLHTLFRTENGNVLKGYINGFLKRRNMGEKEIDDSEAKDSEEEERKQRTELERSGNVPLQHPKTGNYSFYFDENETGMVLELKNRVAKTSGIEFSKISNTEIVRETLHFVFDKRLRNLSFRHLTYVGFLYGLSPVISIILGEIRRKRVSPEALEKYYNVFVSTEDEEFIKKIGEDRERAGQFKERLLSNSSITSSEKVNDTIVNSYSEIGKFNFYLAFVGGELTYYTGRMNLSELTDAVTVFIINDRKKGMIEIAVVLLHDYLSILYDASDEIRS